MKVIANRLKPLLEKLISDTQNSFLPGRQTVGNIILAQEVIHTMRRKKGKQGQVTTKIDLKKVYEKI